MAKSSPRNSCFWKRYLKIKGFPGGSEVKNLSAGDVGSIPGSGGSPVEGNGNPFQYSCLENSMARGARRATVPWVAKKVRHDLATKEQNKIWSLQGFFSFHCKCLHTRLFRELSYKLPLQKLHSLVTRVMPWKTEPAWWERCINRSIHSKNLSAETLDGFSGRASLPGDLKDRLSGYSLPVKRAW